MKKLCILCVLFFLAACDLSTTTCKAITKSNENLTKQSLDTRIMEEGESTATNVLKEDIQFPIWWVQQDFQHGNSPKAVVFFTDGRIYARETQGERLKPVGTWTYDPTYQRIFTSLGADENLKVGTQNDGSWDGKIHFQEMQLIRGSADYTTANILGKYISNLESTENIYQNFVYTRNRAKVMTIYGMQFLPRGTLKFAGIVEGTAQDLQILWQEEDNEKLFKWRIAPLGDAIEFYDLPEPFSGLMMEAKYNGHGADDPIMIRTFAHTNMPVYKKTNIQSDYKKLEIMKNSGGHALMTLLNKD